MPLIRKRPATKPARWLPPPSPNIEWHFYVLAMSQKNVRLFACTLKSIEESRLDGRVPHSLADAQRFLDVGKQYQVHSVPSASKPGAVAHGIGGGREDEKLRIEEYFREV